MRMGELTELGVIRRFSRVDHHSERLSTDDRVHEDVELYERRKERFESADTPAGESVGSGD